MSKHSEWRGNALLGIDGWCRTPFVPGMDVRHSYQYVEHFFPMYGMSANALSGWTVTELTSGDYADAGSPGGVLRTICTVDGQGQQAQGNGLWVLPAAGKEIWCEFGISGITDCDDMDWFVGLAATDTNIFSTDPTEIIAFRGDDGDANIDFQVRDAGTGDAADTGADTGNATAVRLGFYVNGVTSVTPFINGVAYTAVTSNIPTSAARLTFGCLGGATTNPNNFDLDWIRLVALP